ncbi:unnamed protein product [Rotaria sordida]|uniref:Poly [ADP-ribose] polymerase n=1 Tax=Rotaria sordida TaxID=392033 RepID=A0A819L362_9BILA|nr:unnamed protein product [Rotaria sordida]
MDDQEEKRWCNCLNLIIQHVDNVLKELKNKHQNDSNTTDNAQSKSTTTSITANDDDLLFDNSVQNNNVDSFTVDIEEEELLNRLTNDIQSVLQHHLPILSFCSSYLEESLHEYHFDKDKRIFTETLTANILHSFQQNLKGLLMATKAYPAAYNGDQATVQEFLRLHPDYKDKSGFWGTTLLHSAARRGHFNLVKYLIESTGCSVNAQNQQELTYALIADNDTHQSDTNSLGYKPNTRAGSTALHAACDSNYIEIVEYLIDKGANYFLRNQSGETPIDNGQRWESIRTFFEDYLISHYVNTSNALLPKETIFECYDRQPNNCVWEYKLVKGLEWKEFTMREHYALSYSLTLADDNQSFNSAIYLNSQKSTYTVNLLTFYRGSENQEPKSSTEDSAAWIRCRGSSVANFDIYCLWQLMFVKYETNNKSTMPEVSLTPSLDAIKIPSIYDSKFQISMHSWYTCNSELNDLLDQTMNNRRRYVDIDNIHIGHIRCNLFLFTFANDDKTILGFIRWIPKFIVNTPHNQNFIKELDNFQAGNHLNPIPLTTQRSEQSIRSKSTSDDKGSDVDLADNNDTDLVDNLSVIETEADDADENTESVGSVKNSDNWCLADIKNDGFERENEKDDLISITSKTSVIENLSENIDVYISNEHTSQPINQLQQFIVKKTSDIENRIEQDNVAQKVQSILESENEQLKIKLLAFERQLSEQCRHLDTTNDTNQEILNITISTLEETQHKLNEKVQHEDLINETAKEIFTAEYALPKSKQSIIFKYNLILAALVRLDYPHKKYFQDSVPMINFDEKYGWKLILKGFPIHHKELKKMFEQSEDLLDRIQKAEELYEQKTNRKRHLLIQVIERVRPVTPIYWKHYRDYLVKLIYEKCNEYINNFKEHMKDRSDKMLNDCIDNSSDGYRKEIEKLTNNSLEQDTLSHDIDQLKFAALDEFIRDHVLYQQNSTKCVPTKQSISILNQHIDKIKENLSTKNAYKGCALEHFQMIVPLLQGKSTLLPALLIAEGYDKVIVTQPRRLPCSLVSQRVNSMVKEYISGWAVSGVEKNVRAKILYVTDGLLKERLLNDENLITKYTKFNKSLIFLLDEVHERSINIDLCLALFARLLKLNPDLKTKMKLIISSATLDSSVPKLYRKIPGCSLCLFNLPSISTRFLVTDNHATGENILDLVQKLYSKRVRNEQILCFVSSTQDVYENCALIKSITKEAIIAHPLVQSQSAIDQEKLIEHGTLFFSTTVAETSLTFPCLKYVIDTGVINMPVYNIELERTELQEIKAAESTTKQRRGRLGRTQPGEFYALYKYEPGEQQKYPLPQICQSELVNIEFALRKSRLRTTLIDFKEYFPNKPGQTYIEDAVEQLQRLGLVSKTSSKNFTPLGQSIAKLPDLSSLRMAKAVYSALRTYRCGRDLIILSSILSVLNTSAIIKSIPSQYKCPEGDFMTLLNVMNTVLLVRDSVSAQHFDIDRICNAKGLSACAHIIKQALRRYKNLEKAFNLSEEFREDAQIQASSWENIAKALLDGFADNVFVSTKILQGKAQQFLKYNLKQRITDPQQQQSDDMSTIAVIDRTSTLRTGNKGLLPASLVLARDVRYLTAVRSTAILSFVGKIETSWLAYNFTRTMKLNTAEEQKLYADNILQQAIQKFPRIQIQNRDGKLVFCGSSGHILNAELFIRQQLTAMLTFNLESDRPNDENDTLTMNLKSVTKMPIDLFGPLRWRWEAEQQVKVRTKMNTKTGTITVTVEGLDSQNQTVKKEFMSFLNWLRNCAVIRDPHSGVAPRVLKPQIRRQFRDMEEKIGKITDPDRSSVDRWKSVKGPKVTRETRMEVVAWIAVCLFDCRLEGGFVRDWVVGNYSSKPNNLPPQNWVHYDPKSGIPMIHKDVVPSDLDCHLPAVKQFDVEAFLDALYGYGIIAKVFRQYWRYVLLVDENTKTGPFTMDLIEPHIALTHDRIDFDVSNLSLEKLYTRDLGMRVDITGNSHSIQLETIVEHIRKKEFQVLRAIDGENGPNTSGTVAERIQRMKSRGWNQVGNPLNFIPNPPSNYNAILIPYPSSTVLFKNVVAAMQTINGARVISIEQIKNPDIESLYENMKRTISKECPGNDPNERELYHGTSGEAIEGIINRGYDDRYFAKIGAWGSGAYFADDPRKSNGYTNPDPQTNRRVIFYNKVLLGIESVQTKTNKELIAAPIGHHSVHGAGGWRGFQYHEYIVYRYGQALPYLKITYTTPSIK